MYTRLDRAHRALPVILGAVALTAAGALLVCDASSFPVITGRVLRAFPLALVAVAYLFYQTAHRPQPMEWIKAMLLVVAFLFWSANQFWPDQPQATVFNDIAIALFALDVFLVMIGWPASAPDESFAETYVEPGSQPNRHESDAQGI